MRNFYFNLLLVVFLFLFTSACDFFDSKCTTEQNCADSIERNISKNNIDKAVELYDKYVNLTGHQNMSLLYKMAVRKSENFFHGDIKLPNSLNFISFADVFYDKTGMPGLGKKIGVKKITDQLKQQKVLLKIVAAYNLYMAGKKAYLNDLVLYPDNTDPGIKASIASVLSNSMDKKYKVVLEKLYFSTEVKYVRQYAMKGLGYIDYKTYKPELLDMIKNDDVLGKTLAAGALLYNGDNSTIPILKKSLHANSTILVARSLEAMNLKKVVFEEDRIIQLLSANNFMASFSASRFVGLTGNKKYIKYLKDILKKDLRPQVRLNASMGLLFLDDYSGIDNIKKALISDNVLHSITASGAIIEYCKYRNYCKETPEVK